MSDLNHFKHIFKFEVFKQIKGNHSLLPIAVTTFFGFAIGVFTALRTLTQSPDVIIDRKHNPRPYEKWEHKPYRYFKQHLEQDDPDKPKLD